MPRQSYEVEEVGNTVTGVEEVKDPGVAIVFTVFCQYGTHADTPEFRRIITSVYSDEKGKLRYAVVQYFFKGGKKVPVILSSHGNTKSDTPHLQTARSICENIAKQ